MPEMLWFDSPNGKHEGILGAIPVIVTAPLHLHLLAPPSGFPSFSSTDTDNSNSDKSAPLSAPKILTPHPRTNHLQAARRIRTTDSSSKRPRRHNMLTYTEYYQSTPSPLGVGPTRDLAYQTIYDYFAEETASPILLGRLLDLFEPEPYPGPLTAPSTNKGKAFGYLDDIKGDAGELVLVDAALLEQAPKTLVLSLDRHLNVIKHAHHSHMIPMVLGDDPHMEPNPSHHSSDT
eukprot:jgi/Psemu1/10005/gm1.10005_g